MDSEHLIKFWELYNRHLVELIKLIPKENLAKQSKTDYEKIVTLEWLIRFNSSDLEHHLKQLLIIIKGDKMEMKKYLIETFEFNSLMNKKLLEKIKKLPEEECIRFFSLILIHKRSGWLE